MKNSNFNAGVVYAEYTHRKLAYVLSALVAFTMSSYFVVGYLAGDLLFWDWDISQLMNGLVGIGICGVMTAYQFILYSQGDVEGGKKATILAVCVAVGFSLLSEVGQGMERDHIRMESKSIQSPTFKAIVSKVGHSAANTSHPYSSDLQTAQMKLARCQKNVADGIWNDCIESSARLSTVENMIASYYQQSEQTTASLVSTAKSLEKDESNYHPLVSLIKTLTSSTGVVASFLLSLLLISFFEYAFHYLGRQLAAKRSELLSHGYDVTRKKRKTPRTLNPDQIELPLPPSDDNSDLDTRESELAATRDAPCTVHGDKPFNAYLYEQLSLMVRTGQIAPTFRPVKTQLKSWDVGTSDRKRQEIASVALDRMATDGILKLNPKTGGIKAAKYVLADGYDKKLLGTAEHQLSMDLDRGGLSHG